MSRPNLSRRAHAGLLLLAIFAVLGCRLFEQALRLGESTALPTAATLAPVTPPPSPTSLSAEPPTPTSRPKTPTARPPTPGSNPPTPISLPVEPSPVGPTVVPTPITLPKPDSPGVVYEEDFNGGGASLGWTLDPIDDDYATVQHDLFGGAYRWRIDAHKNVFTMVHADAPILLPNPYFLYTVRVSLSDAPADISYGLLFYVADNDNLFYAQVRQTGEYALYSMENNQFDTLAAPRPTHGLHTGPDAVNWLSLERKADWITFYVNGVYQEEWTLGDYPGGLGLAVELSAGESASVLFDDITLCDMQCQ